MQRKTVTIYWEAGTDVYVIDADDVCGATEEELAVVGPSFMNEAGRWCKCKAVVYPNLGEKNQAVRILRTLEYRE